MIKRWLSAYFFRSFSTMHRLGTRSSEATEAEHRDVPTLQSRLQCANLYGGQRPMDPRVGRPPETVAGRHRRRRRRPPLATWGSFVDTTDGRTDLLPFWIDSQSLQWVAALPKNRGGGEEIDCMM